MTPVAVLRGAARFRRIGQTVSHAASRATDIDRDVEGSTIGLART
jgi:hypothetical protein